MYTLKGIFPEPKKEQKRNFIRENMKQLKTIPGKFPRETKERRPEQGASAGTVRSVPSNERKVASTLKIPDVRIKKGDMAEFLKRKEQRKVSAKVEAPLQSSGSECSAVRDIGCQTVESTLPASNVTVLYPRAAADQDCSGDTGRRDTGTPGPRDGTPGAREGTPGARARTTALVPERKDPYLPPGYQKGVLPKYLRERKGAGEGAVGGGAAEGGSCPPGHVALPDSERKETLRMLRSRFADLVNELNKMPVRTDTLRMRIRSASSFAELVNELNKMPVRTDTLRMRSRKMELERQLAKLEEGIKVFSRPQVFVKIGE